VFGRKRDKSTAESDGQEVLAVLDRCAAAFTFPMLDNGYIYPAAARLSVHSDGSGWAIVVETFGYSPRAGHPDLNVATFTSSVPHPKTRADYVNEAAYLNYLKQHPHDAVEFFWPLDEGDWLDDERVVPGTTVLLRGREVSVPTVEDCQAVGITPTLPDGIAVFELARYFAEARRDDVLATGEERTKQVPTGLSQVLLLDQWHHPDLVRGERPSDTQTFRQIAAVAASGDARKYEALEPPNTHWSNWPEGGLL
jgi:hypothetical protein